MPAARDASATTAWREEVRRLALRRGPVKPAPPPRGLRDLAIGVAIVVHLFLWLALRSAMHVQVEEKPRAIEVVLLTPNPPIPPPPQPPPLRQKVDRPKAQARTLSAPALPSAVTVPPIAAATAPVAKPLELYQSNGNFWQPRQSAAPPLTPIERARELLARGHNVVNCRRTRFADGYRKDESLGDRIARRYLSWIGLYGEAAAERLARREAEAREACDGI